MITQIRAESELISKRLLADRLDRENVLASPPKPWQSTSGCEFPLSALFARCRRSCGADTTSPSPSPSEGTHPFQLPHVFGANSGKINAP